MNLNINLKELRADKDTIINAGIILIAVFIGINIYKSGAANIKFLQEKKTEESNKNALLDEIIKSGKMFDSYKTSINKKDISLVINTIGDMANKSGVNIISIRPSAKEEFPVYTRHHFNLKCEANSYHLIGKFIGYLESHPDSFFIDALSFRRTSKREGPGQLDQKEIFTVELTLNTITIKG